jgi:hypothetical protein
MDMSWGGPSFVIAIIAVCYGGWLLNNWIRARHGYPLENEWGGGTTKSERQGAVEADRQVALLSAENADLKGKLLRIEERVAVLERIATDKAGRLSDEIEKLR